MCQSSTTDADEFQKHVEAFLSDRSNQQLQDPHTYTNLAGELLRYEGLLDFAQRMVEKGIELNSEQNLRKLSGGSRLNLEHQQNLEFGRLYSHYAWIHWRKGKKRV